MDTHFILEDSPPRQRGKLMGSSSTPNHVTQGEYFYSDLYLYYTSKGLTNFIVKRLASLFTTTFIILFCSFVFSFVQWGKILACPEHHGQSGTCGAFSSYVNWSAWESPSSWHVMVIGNMVIMCLYWLWAFLATGPAIFTAFRIYNYLKNELRVSTRRLQSMTWEELLTVHAAYKRIPNTDQWLKTVSARIMKNENYLIALVRQRVIRIRCCYYDVPFSHSLYWILHAVLAGPMKTAEAKTIRKRSICVGILVLITLPFAFMFLITFFLIKHAEEFHVHKDYLGPRTWTLRAKTLFRKYNELPHEFQERMVGSFKPATEYIAQFHDPVNQTTAQFLSFICSALLTVLAALTLFDESIMLHVTIGSRNLLFYLATLSFVMASLHVFIPEPTELPLKPQEKMEILQRFIEYNPPEWEGQWHTLAVRDDFMKLFRLRIRHFLDEVIAAIFLPFILLCHLPGRSEIIARFLRSNTREDPSVGDVLSSSIDWEMTGSIRETNV